MINEFSGLLNKQKSEKIIDKKSNRSISSFSIKN